MTATKAMYVVGIRITESSRGLRPYIEISDALYGLAKICEYGSTAAMDAGMSDPNHWAHEVYQALLRFCESSYSTYSAWNGDMPESAQVERRIIDKIMEKS
jgi:hypothetical protein